MESEDDTSSVICLGLLRYLHHFIFILFGNTMNILLGMARYLVAAGFLLFMFC